jgi:hypothetical protein
MEALTQHSVPSRNWPPERGWPLFLAWMGGIIAVSLISIAFSVARIGILSPTAGWSDRLLWVFPALAGHAWQAWLLFRKHPLRFGLWTTLPLLQVIPVDPIKLIPYLSLVIPLLEAAMLRKIRQRAWAWILASMAGVVAECGGFPCK